MSPGNKRRPRERGAALVMVVIFTLMAVSGVMLFLERSHVELRESRLKAAAVKNLFHVHSALNRAHKEINYWSTLSSGPNQNLALIDPEVVEGQTFIANTNRTVAVRTVKPSDQFDMSGNEIAPAGGYQNLPSGWYVLEARVTEPLYTRLDDGQKLGALKLVRQYVRDGTPLSNNFVLVTDDDLGLGGSPVNPGKPAEGHMHTNKHMYIMTPNPYYANPMSASDGMSYTAGATEAGTVFLHPDNDWDADEVHLPLPSDLVSNPDGSNDYLKAHALGASPTSLNLSSATLGATGTIGGYAYKTGGGITAVSQLKTSGSDPTPSMYINTDADGVTRGVVIGGYVDSEVVMDGDTFTVTMWKRGTPSKYLQIKNVPMAQDGVIFLDNLSGSGATNARTTIHGELSTRTTLATTGNVDISDSVQYVDEDGDLATKLVYTDDLDGVDKEDWGTVADISQSTSISNTAEVTYMANQRPQGVVKESGDGFYDGAAVLGVVASQDVVILDDVPQNAEIAGAYLSLEKRLTLEGMGYNSSGNLTSISSSSSFYVSNGGKSSIRRFGGLITKKRPATAVVNGSTGAFLYGFKRGFSLFDEEMKQHPPPYFPKDKKPEYLGWELKDLGVRPIN